MTDFSCMDFAADPFPVDITKLKDADEARALIEEMRKQAPVHDWENMHLSVAKHRKIRKRISGIMAYWLPVEEHGSPAGNDGSY